MIFFFFIFFLNRGVLLCFEGRVCNGETSPLDGRNDGRKAQGDPRCGATKPRGPRHGVGLSLVVSGHRVGPAWDVTRWKCPAAACSALLSTPRELRGCQPRAQPSSIPPGEVSGTREGTILQPYGSAWKMEKQKVI